MRGCIGDHGAHASPDSSAVYSRRAARWRRWTLAAFFILEAILTLFLPGCSLLRQDSKVAIEFTRVPPFDQGGPDIVDTAEGRVRGAKPGQRIVLWARSGVWWVQPSRTEAFVAIQPDATWRTTTHLGTEYAALLVEAGYHPPATLESLPQPGGDVAAVLIVPGDRSRVPNRHIFQFGGYEWVARATPSSRDGANDYDPANAWTDASGALHLKISGSRAHWNSAEVVLTRSLGYGTYVFVVRDVSQLQPPALFAIFTWDGPAEKDNHRELDVDFGNRGSSKNARYMVQPYYVAGNQSEFTAPRGVLTHSMRWAPGAVEFNTKTANGRVIAEHRFVTGTPSPGNEHVRFSLHVAGRGPGTWQKETEVVLEKFQYFP